MHRLERSNTKPPAAEAAAGRHALLQSVILGENKSLFTPARDRNEALALFGRELNLKLTLDDSDTVIARYLLDEWDFPGPHWANHTIPVFEMPADAN